MLSEQPHSTIGTGIHLVHQWIGVLRQTSREYNELVVLRHDLKEIVDARSLLHENVAHGAFDVDRDDEVGVLDLIELAVYQGLIQIEHQCFHAFILLGWWT